MAASLGQVKTPDKSIQTNCPLSTLEYMHGLSITVLLHPEINPCVG